MFKVKYVDSIMMLVRLDLNLIVSLFQHKCEVSTTTLVHRRLCTKHCTCTFSTFVKITMFSLLVITPKCETIKIHVYVVAFVIATLY